MQTLKKKGLTALIAAILMLSMVFAIIPIASASPLTIILDKSSGPVGQVVVVSGLEATPGLGVEIYWDAVKPENLLNETIALGDGSYECQVTIPEATAGEHWIIAYDITSKTAKGAAFGVEPEILLKPTSGLPGDTLTVEGQGFPGSENIDIFFDNPAVRLIEQYGTLLSTAEWATDPAATHGDVVKLVGVDDGSEAAAGVYISDGPTLDGDKAITITNLGFSYYGGASVTNVPDFALRFVAPTCIDPDDDTSMYRGHVDVGFTGLGAASSGSWVDVSFTGSEEVVIFGNKPLTGEAFSKFGLTWAGVLAYLETVGLTGLEDWVLTRVSPQVGWAVIGTYYVDDVKVEGITYDLEQSVKTATSNSLGSFTADFLVPDAGDGPHEVSAIDGVDNSFAFADFTIGACITLVPEEGPTGTVVTIAGRGFTAGGTITSIKIDETPIDKPSTITIGASETPTEGEFTADVIIPTLTAVGEYDIEVTDGSRTAKAPFTVTGLPKITVSPKFGVPGESIAVEGVNFTAIADTEVTLTLIEADATEHLAGTLKTNAAGGFKDTFKIPAIPWGPYTLEADDGNVTATTPFLVGMVYATLTPDEGPTGIKVTVAGTGFTELSTVNGTLDSILVFEDTVELDGTFSAEFYVPTVAVGAYTVTIMDAEGVAFEVPFTVTKTTELILTPNRAPKEYVVDVEANYFTAILDTAITFTLKNATWSSPLAVTATDPWVAVKTDATGSFKGTFVVPIDPTIVLGDYIINATDANGLTVEVPFSIVEVYREIRTLLTEYDPGDTVSFYVKATFAFDLRIDIKDPTGYPFTTIGPITVGEWVQVDDWWVVPYAKASFILPSDATPGAWNWTAYEVVTTEPLVLEKVDTDIFTVSGVPPGPPPVLPAEISGEETLDSTGAPKTSFALGETVLVSATVTNIGTTSQPMLIVVQLMDPDLRALAPTYISMTVPAGLSITPSFGFEIPVTGYAAGTWTAKVMVLDTWPALGGVPIAEPVTVTFTVTS